MDTPIKISLMDFDVPTVARESIKPAPPVLPTPREFPEVEEYSAMMHVNIPLREFYLSEVPADALDEMCDKFRDEVFRRAKKDRPVAPEYPPAPLYDITPILKEIRTLIMEQEPSVLDQRLTDLIRSEDSAPGIVISVLRGAGRTR